MLLGILLRGSLSYFSRMAGFESIWPADDHQSTRLFLVFDFRPIPPAEPRIQDRTRTVRILALPQVQQVEALRFCRFPTVYGK